MHLISISYAQEREWLISGDHISTLWLLQN